MNRFCMSTLGALYSSIPWTLQEKDQTTCKKQNKPRTEISDSASEILILMHFSSQVVDQAAFSAKHAMFFSGGYILYSGH